MAIALGRLVLLALGCLGPSPSTIRAARVPSRGEPGTAAVEAAAQTGTETPVADAVDLPEGFEAFVWQPYIESRPALTGLRRPPPPPDIQKRDCLANGTNFCFGDSSNFCSSCGTCCSGSSKWCCPSDSICCGSSCCASGQTCNNGKCYLPVVTVTETSAVSVTVTQAVTDIATIIQEVVESSVVNSVVTVTATDAETETDWTYVTVTTVGKRALPSGPPVDVDTSVKRIRFRDQRAAVTATVPNHEVERRQATAETMAATAATVTVNQAVTVTAVATHIVSSSTTVLTTSTTVQTVVNTVTKVLNAKATIQATSTLTFTSHLPVTLTVTQVATEHASAPADGRAGDPSATPALVTNIAGGGMPHSSLSSSSIAGIAVGSAIFALIASLLFFFLIRRRQRRRRARQEIEEEYAYLGTGRSSVGPTNFSGPPPPSAATFGHKSVGSDQTQLDMQQNERGLPPIPWFSRLSSPAEDGQRLQDQQQQQQPRRLSSFSPFYAKTAHMRSGSGQTTGTAASSTVVGGNNSQRTSVSTPGAVLPPNAANLSHQRGSSSGAGSGMTAETVGELAGDDSGNHQQLQQQRVPESFAIHQPQQQSTPQEPPESDHLAAPTVPWVGGAAGGPSAGRNGAADSETSSMRSSIHPSPSNVVTKGGGFFYRDY